MARSAQRPSPGRRSARWLAGLGRSPRRRAREGAGAPSCPVRENSDRTAPKPSAVTMPRATRSQRPSCTSVGRRRVAAGRSEENMAPYACKASRTSRPAPWTGSSGTASPLVAAVSQGRSARRVNVTGVARDGVDAPRRGLAVGLGGTERQAAPAHLSCQTEVLQPALLVTLDPGREDRFLPGAGGQLEALQLFDHGQQAGSALSASAGGHVLPAQQEPHEVLSSDRLDFSPQPVLACSCGGEPGGDGRTIVRACPGRGRTGPAWRSPRPPSGPARPGPGSGPGSTLWPALPRSPAR